MKELDGLMDGAAGRQVKKTGHDCRKQTICRGAGVCAGWERRGNWEQASEGAGGGCGSQVTGGQGQKFGDICWADGEQQEAEAKTSRDRRSTSCDCAVLIRLISPLHLSF